MIHKYRLSGLKSKCGLTLITGFDKILPASRSTAVPVIDVVWNVTDKPGRFILNEV